MGTAKKIIPILVFILVFAGCFGGSSNGTSSSNTSGFAQKGPFIEGSDVTAYKLDEGNNYERSTTEFRTTQTNDNRGSFTLVVPWSGPTEYEIKGDYLNETTGEYSSYGELTAVVNTQANISSEININIFTHIASSQIKESLKNNKTIEEAKAESNSKLSEIFGINTSPENLNLIDGNGENKADNLQLLKASAAILSQENHDDILSKIVDDLKDGNIDTEAEGLFSDLQEQMEEVNLSEVSVLFAEKLKLSKDSIPSNEDRVGELPLNHGLYFEDKLDVEKYSLNSSTQIIVSHLMGEASLSIENGEYYLNDTVGSTVETSVKNGDRIKVMQTSSHLFSMENVTVLNIGNTKIPFKTITKSDPNTVDTTPNTFTFKPKVNLKIQKTASSNEIIVSGLSPNTTTTISIEGGTYSINDGAKVFNNGTVVNGDRVRVYKTAGHSHNSKYTAILNIGGISSNFDVFTRGLDRVPDDFTIESKYEVGLNEIVETEYITAFGYEGGVDLSVENGEVQLYGDDTWLPVMKNLPAGYKVRFRQTSASTYRTNKTTKIKFGGRVIEFNTQTQANPNILDNRANSFEFKTLRNVNAKAFVESEQRLITGIDGTTGTTIQASSGVSFKVNDGGWTQDPTKVVKGDKVSLKAYLDSFDASYTLSLYYGVDKTEFATLDVFTAKANTKPNPILFEAIKNANTSTLYISNTVTISGINTQVNAKIYGLIGGTYRINNGIKISANTVHELTLNEGDTISFSRYSLSSDDSLSRVVLAFDETSYNWDIKTAKKPIFINNISTQINEDTLYSFTPDVRDSQTLTYKIENKPSWIELDTSTGKIEGTPLQENVGVHKDIKIIATNESGLNSELIFDLEVLNINDAPLLSNTWANEFADENKNYKRSASVLDEDSNTFTWSIVNNPLWLSIDANTGELSGIPRQADVGSVENIKVVVIDSEGLSDFFTFKVIVKDINSAPILSSISDKTVNEDEELIVQARASDLDSDVLTFGIQNKPSWLNFDTSSGKLSGTPSQNDIGVKDVTISVTDGHGTTMFEDFKITVVDVNYAPSISSNDFRKEFILDDTSTTPKNYILNFDISDADNSFSELIVNHKSEVLEVRVGFGKSVTTMESTIACLNTKCSASISFGFNDLDGFHPSLKTRHTFTVSDGDKSKSNYIDIWYAPTKPVLGGETSHTIEVKDKVSYEAFSFTPTNSGNKARTWEIKNKPDGFTFDTSTGEFKYTPLGKGLLLNDTVFKDIEISATNDRGVSNKFVFSVLVKGKPPAPKFTFTDKIGVEIQQFFDASITVNWLEQNEIVPISLSNYQGQSVHTGYRVNGQTNVTTVKNNDIVIVWHKSSNEYDTTLGTTITIGDSNDTFNTKTKASSASKLPLIVGSPNFSGNTNEVYTYTPQLSTDYTKFAPVTKPFTIENKPSWATFDSISGTLSGTPTQIAEHKQVRITAFGDNGLDDITFDITIRNDGPYINGFGHSLENTDLSFTYDDNSDWRSKINKVSMYACYDQSEAVILNPNDYTFTEGSLKLHSSTSTNPILHIPIMGGGRLIVESDGYGNSEALIDMVEDGQYGVKANILEENGKIKISLSNHLEFRDNTLDISSFLLYQAPNGTVVKSVEYIDSTNALIELAHTGISNNQALNIQISINSSELNICQNVESNTIEVSQIEKVSRNVIKTGVVDTLINEDDGFYKKGQNRSYAYTDNIDYHTVHTNVVLDNNTGLQWQNNKLVTSVDYSSLEGNENWDKAVKYCSDLTLDTYSDWRLPSINELLTLIDYSKQDKMLDDMFSYFGPLANYPDSYNYWSSTEHSGDNGFAWGISLKNGEHHYGGKNSPNNLICVRGNTLKKGSYSRSVDGVVKDFSTNLSWQDNEVYHSNSIDDAITYCQNLTLGNNSNWRVPNVNELKTLLEHDNHPLNISEVFQNANTTFYYSSTQSSADNSKYWIVDFDGGGTDGKRPQSNYKTRCVSGDNIVSIPSVEVKVLDNTDSDADVNHITLGIELKGTTFTDENVLIARLNRAPDKDVQAQGGFVYVDETHAYIVENMENISEDITVSFTIHNTEINYDENITSNSIVIKKPITAPDANAGEDQNVPFSSEVILDASNSSDNNGSIVSYEWKEGNNVLSTSKVFSKWDFSVGEHIVTLTVIDNEGEVGIDSVKVVVYTDSITHDGFTYNIITSPITGKKWLDRNLGASEVCTKSRDNSEFTDDITYINDQKSCFGDLYQWGRLTDGHEKRGSNITNTKATDISNAGINFIENAFDWVDDLIDDSKNLRSAQWSKTDGTSICPVGFRVPSLIELEIETKFENVIENEVLGIVKIIDHNTAFKNFLRFPSSGYRNPTLYEGGSAHIWTTSFSTVVIASRSLYFSKLGAVMDHTYPNTGGSVRCIKN